MGLDSKRSFRLRTHAGVAVVSIAWLHKGGVCVCACVGGCPVGTLASSSPTTCDLGKLVTGDQNGLELVVM